MKLSMVALSWVIATPADFLFMSIMSFWLKNLESCTMFHMREHQLHSFMMRMAVSSYIASHSACFRIHLVRQLLSSQSDYV